uniref:Uncharacterized protein n=1 Tax=Vibrio tasmaniensis TaxID=212663 RepID=A0A0H4A3D8_9VIBR|nr:hypothetical protein [Vibrio tasmaniensis]
MRLDTTTPWYYRVGFVFTLTFCYWAFGFAACLAVSSVISWEKGVITLAMVAFTWVSYQTWLDIAPLVDQIMELHAL